MKPDKYQREIERRHDEILEELFAPQDSVPSPETVSSPELTRAQIKERCKLAYITGSASLLDLAQKYDVPYNSMMGWSSDHGWGIEREKASAARDRTLPDKAGNWLAENQSKQVERALRRALALQSRSDEALRRADEKNELTPQAVRDSATTEEKLDAIIRRNLSMDLQAAGGSRFNLNVLGNVEIIGPK